MVEAVRVRSDDDVIRVVRVLASDPVTVAQVPADDAIKVVRVPTSAPVRVTVSAHGVAGKSAYELAVDSGFAGTLTEWLASLRGTAGDAAGSFTFVQSVAQSVWGPIEHNLGYDPAGFVLLGSDGYQYDGFTVQYLIPGKSLRISSDVPLSGRLYIS